MVSKCVFSVSVVSTEDNMCHEISSHSTRDV